MEDQRSVTLTTTHCNETTESRCEINNITNLTNGKSLVPEANLTMQNISPLSTVRTTTNAKTHQRSQLPHHFHSLLKHGLETPLVFVRVYAVFCTVNEHIVLQYNERIIQ